MTMIRISQRVHLAADQIAMIETPEYNDRVIVLAKDGQRYDAELGWGQLRYERVDELLRQVNEATRPRVETE
ncbi:hypothetical protein [Pseudomonas sp. UBA6323]|uniref:hypothetical protein n=1 Tax=Pseudomonas sp. UBA6323 TaxID=1947329 RepID=UPI0025D1D5FB|nr:hypothetical protein [Pseudomonas sp. UBA6323]